MSAAASGAGVDLDSGADIVMGQFTADRDRRPHAAVDVYVPLHSACAGHGRLAATASNDVVEPGSGDLTALVSRSASFAARVA